MASKQSLAIAINKILDTIRLEKQKDKVDMELFANNCIKEFLSLDLPFYSISPNKQDKDTVTIEVPFLKQASIKIEQYLFGSKDKSATLYINNKATRKIKLEDKNPEYMARVAHGLLDYLKRYMILKSKF